jgi:hypothetical protein
VSDNDHIKEVYARFGLAVYMAQCLERSLASALVLVHGPGPKAITRQELDALLDQAHRQTMGTLLKQLQGKSSIDGLEQQLQEGLAKRNWLIHSFFWDRAGHFMSNSGRELMLTELSEIRALLEAVDERLDAVCEDWALAHGVTRESLEEHVKKLVAEGAV